MQRQTEAISVHIPSLCPIILPSPDVHPPALRHSPSRRRGASLRVMRPMSQTDPDHAAEPHEGQEGTYCLLCFNLSVGGCLGSLVPFYCLG